MIDSPFLYLKDLTGNIIGIYNENGITGNLYTGLYIGSNIISSLSTIGGNAYRNSKISFGVSQASKTGKAYSRYYQMEGIRLNQLLIMEKMGLLNIELMY